MSEVIFVVAHDRRGVMGRGGAMPWHLPEDLKHFRRLTIDKPTIMGRKTFASLGKALPRRRNIVLTRDAAFSAPDVEVAHSVEQALETTRDAREIAVIGGSEIFKAFAAFVDVAYVTRVEAELDGDVFYTPPDRPHETETLSTYAADERNPYDLTFLKVTYRTSAAAL
jgi:dihydrofolate reductase